MLRLYLLGLFLLGAGTCAQVLPDGVNEVPFVCPAPEAPAQPTSEAERLQLERRARYRRVLPAYFAAVPETPDPHILMPLPGLRVSDVTDTWGSARGGGRTHEGQDLFAPAGTPILSGTPGYIYRIGPSILGGNTVVVVGGGGWRYYYAHLSSYNEMLLEGQYVGTDTVLGYVGNTGNARSTPPHLHLSIYTSEPGRCDWNALDPLPRLVNRD